MLRYWRVFVFLVVVLVIGSIQLYGVFSNEGYAPEQPINFSHVIHAGALQMECLYCHSSAEKGAHAGIPSVELCMGCHSIVQTQSPEIQKLTEYYNNGEPVPWVRIHRLPDHAYFNHKWHVEAGVACQECHGPIQSMPKVGQWRKLEMAACMECHRNEDYADQVHHSPTYHEGGLDVEKAPAEGEALYEAAGAGPQDPSFLSASDYIRKYHGNMSPDEKRAMLVRLTEYREDLYNHGRVVQLRGQNASVECSTCHY